MKVMHITFNMAIGGTEQVIKQLVLGMMPYGVNSEIICIDNSLGPIGLQLEKNGVPISVLSRKPGIDLGIVKKIRSEILEKKVDVLHCHQYTPWFYGLLGSVGTGVRVVFTEHGRFYPDKKRYKAAFLNPLMALFTNRVVAISKATSIALSRFEFIPQKFIEVVYNGVRGMTKDSRASTLVRNEIGVGGDALVFGTVSRLDSVKNQRMMISAFRSFRNRGGEGRLLIVGDGPERASLEEQVKNLDLTSDVVFTGFIDNPEAHLGAMDVFLLSSFTEGTSMTLLEAMSLGIPQIVTNVGGNPEIVKDGKTGVLLESDNVEAMSSAMLALSADTIRRSEFAEASIQHFKANFSLDTMIDRYLQIYRQAERSH